MSPLDHHHILSPGWKGRTGERASWMCLRSPLFHLLVKPHRERAGTFKAEHKGLPCVSNDVYFLIMKFPTQIPVRGWFLNASSNDAVFACGCQGSSVRK